MSLLETPVLPASFLQSLDGIAGYKAGPFLAVHQSGEQVTSLRYNPLKWKKELPHFEEASKIPWAAHGYYLSKRPVFTLDPLLHAGVYYVQEASSMFLEKVMQQLTPLASDIKLLDLCAAPGGKSTLLQSLITPNSLLVSNEVIKTRVSILEENMTKWGAANVVVTHNDPKDFQKLEGYFDVIVIDAPCSGSGLFRRDPHAISEWSEQNVLLCSQRQQRILADAWPALKEEGILIYSTCSYSVAEDENIMDWMVTHLNAAPLPVHPDPSWNIVETRSPEHNAYGYRFYPDQLKGEGFFIAAFKKTEATPFEEPKLKKTAAANLVSKAQRECVSPFLLPLPFHLFSMHEVVYAFPKSLERDLQILQSALYIKKAGVAIGTCSKDTLIPDHELAVSTIIQPSLPAYSLTLEEALRYLRKEELLLPDAPKGWCLLQYEGFPLGWAKMLPNRINNYYPKEWRIRMGG